MAFKYLSRGVELGNPDAQYQMGKEQRNAANQHDRLLQQYAGVAAALNINAEDGEGIRVTELRTAFELFRKAAAQGGGLYSSCMKRQDGLKSILGHS